MKYSVIIPVYNAEEYLDICVGSILSQNASCEIILVDDGSTDNSPAMCDSYAKENSNVMVIHTSNSGAGKARNTGAETAQGEYIIFVDADDYLSGDFFEKLEDSDTDKNAQVVFFSAVKVFGDGTQVPMNDGLEREKIYKKSKNDVLSHISECNKFPASCWGKIIKHDFYKQSGIRLSEKLVGEDIDWTLALMEKAESFDLFEDGVYYYRKSPGTRSSHKNTVNVSDQLAIVEKWKKHSFDKETKQYFMSFLAYQYAMIFPFYGALDRAKRKDYRQRMRENIYLLDYGKTRKLKAIKSAVRILGTEMASKLLYRYVLRRDKGNMK